MKNIHEMIQYLNEKIIVNFMAPNFNEKNCQFYSSLKFSIYLILDTVKVYDLQSKQNCFTSNQH